MVTVSKDGISYIVPAEKVSKYEAMGYVARKPQKETKPTKKAK